MLLAAFFLTKSLITTKMIKDLIKNLIMRINIEGRYFMEKRKRSVIMAILRTRRVWMEHAKAVAHEMGIPDSYRMIIMYLLREPGANQKDIADFCNVTTAAINQTVKEMIATGYLEKKTDEQDRRYTKLYLTEKGREIALKLREKLRVSDEVITAAITPEKEAEMIELLDKIQECIRRDLTSC
jgi:DNA-binding MarR family transcriptional regulator